MTFGPTTDWFLVGCWLIILACCLGFWIAIAGLIEWLAG